MLKKEVISNKIESWVLYLISCKKVSYATNICVCKMKGMLAKCRVVLTLAHLTLSERPMRKDAVIIRLLQMRKLAPVSL